MNRIFLLSFLLFFVNLHTLLAQEQDLNFVKKIPCLKYTYQQFQFQEEDFLGDLLLVESMKALKKSIWFELKSNFKIRKSKKKSDSEINNEPNDIENFNSKVYCLNNFPEITSDIDKELVYIDSSASEIKATILPITKFSKREMTRKMIAVLDEFAIENKIDPQLGKIPDWSILFRERYSQSYPRTRSTSKLLYCLVRGVCSRYMISGFENKLKEFIYAQASKSLTPEKLFKESLIITGGNVSMALLTIENVLSRFWLAPNREDLLLTTKLQALAKSKDVFGHWYHLFGIMLYGFAKSGFKASLIGEVEQIGSIVLSGFKDFDRTEGKLNRQGGYIGSSIRKHVLKHYKR